MSSQLSDDARSYFAKYRTCCGTPFEAYHLEDCPHANVAEAKAFSPYPRNQRSVLLDLDDPWHRAIAMLLDTHETKGADYARDHDQFDNFHTTSEQFNLQHYEAGEFNCVQKLARLRSLRANGRAPQNESVEDTYKDLAVYGVLTYAMYLQAVHASKPQVAQGISKAPEGSVPGESNVAQTQIPTETPGVERGIPEQCRADFERAGVHHTCVFPRYHRQGAQDVQPDRHYHPAVGYWE